MKKSFLLLGLSLLLLGSCVPCQFLVRGGGNIASVGGDETDNLSSRFAPFAAVGTECNLFDKFSLQPELVLSMQGAEYEMSEGFDGRFKFTYLNLPVMGKIYVSDGLFLEAGPQVGLLLSAKDEYDTPTSGEDDIKDDLKSTDFGANVGLGYQFDSGLNVNARYTFGISDINDFAESPGVDFSNQNNVLALGVGFRF